MGECAYAVAGMETEKVNELLDKLVSMYEKDYKTAPVGKPYEECYDTKTLQPTQEYVDVYNEAIRIMTDLGLDYWTKKEKLLAD